MLKYWLPEIPVTPVDLINRRAAATGSVRYAQLSSYADYNGHSIIVEFKPHAVSGPTWNAEYYWGGRVVIGRGSLDNCLRAAKQEHDKGAHGCLVRIHITEGCPESCSEQIKLFTKYNFVEMPEDTRKHFWTGAHEAVCNAMSYEQHGHFGGMIQYALQFEGAIGEWEKERESWIEDYRAKKNVANK